MTSMDYIHCTRVRSNLIPARNYITPARSRSKSNVGAKLTLKPCTPTLKEPLVVFCSDAVVLVKRNPLASLTLLWMATKVMEVMKGLDLKRYMGRWYEIACFPSRFQPSDGVNTRATYTFGDDGTVRVLNETWSGGKRSFIEGTAHKADPNSDEAKLKVRFWVPPFLPVIPVTGDYWVLFIDPDYQYALIGQPSRNYLWVRTPFPFSFISQCQTLKIVAKEQFFNTLGINVSNIRFDFEKCAYIGLNCDV